jgi:DNA polymerase-3 subunit delta'
MALFEEIIGHEQILRTLGNAIRQERVSHAYLFSGPQGVGKRTVAQAFARALLCTSPIAGVPCDLCRSCKQARHGNHPDFRWVRPEGVSVKIQQVREIQRTVGFRAYQGGRSITVIEQADRMTLEAANCLLKTLEEPPVGAHFILLDDQSQPLPATVISRCQGFFFETLTQREVAEYLESRLGVSRDEAVILAAMSDGSPGKAITNLDENIRQGRESALKTATILGQSGCVEALAEAEEVAKKRAEAPFLLDMLVRWYRDLLIWQETKNSNLLFNRDRLPIIENEANNYSIANLVCIIEDITEAKKKIASNASVRMTLEALFLKLQSGRLTNGTIGCGDTL